MKKIIFTVILIMIDQIIKLIINFWGMEFKMVFYDFIGFTPYLNTSQLSIFNNEFGMNLSNTILIVLNILIIILVVWFYLYSKKHSEESNIQKLNVMYVFLLAGTCCSLIDKIFWGGSLDYIRIMSIIVDLKDIYLVLGAFFYFLWVLSSIQNERDKNKKK